MDKKEAFKKLSDFLKENQSEFNESGLALIIMATDDEGNCCNIMGRGTDLLTLATLNMVQFPQLRKLLDASVHLSSDNGFVNSFKNNGNDDKS